MTQTGAQMKRLYVKNSNVNWVYVYTCCTCAAYVSGRSAGRAEKDDTPFSTLRDGTAGKAKPFFLD